MDKKLLSPVVCLSLLIWSEQKGSIASESRETESRPEASSHGYWIHQLDTRKNSTCKFYLCLAYVAQNIKSQMNPFAQILWIFPVFPIISTCKCVDENLQSPSLSRSLSLTHCIDNVIHHLKNKIPHERFCTIKGIQYYGCAYKSEINHWCSASNFSLL